MNFLKNSHNNGSFIFTMILSKQWGLARLDGINCLPSVAGEQCTAVGTMWSRDCY